MMKVLKAKMFIIIKSLTCHYLVTTALAKQYLERPVTERIFLLFASKSAAHLREGDRSVMIYIKVDPKIVSLGSVQTVEAIASGNK